MDKFYVKSKRQNNNNNNIPSKVRTPNTATTAASRTSEEIFQTSSNGKRLGVGNMYSKILHKIENNLTPKISVKMYKSRKHSKSLSTLSSIGATTGKYTLTNKYRSCIEGESNIVDVQNEKSKLNDDISDVLRSGDMLKNPYDECYNTSTVYSNFSKSLSSYIDSEEDEPQLSLNFVKTSLEDEIFEELKRAAHDDKKLEVVLKTFDKIIFDYNDPLPQTKTNENIHSRAFSEFSNIEKSREEENQMESVDITLFDFRHHSNNKNLNDSVNINAIPNTKLKKSFSFHSLRDSLDSQCFEKQRSRFVWDHSNFTNIPFLKSMPLLSRSKSFCYYNSNEIQNNIHLESLQRTWKSFAPYFTSTIQGSQKISDNHEKNQTQSKLEIIRTQTKTSSGFEDSSNDKDRPPANTNVVHSFQKPLRSVKRNKKSDELLDKCLEKGQQILRKVESINAHRSNNGLNGKKALIRTKSNLKRENFENNPTFQSNQRLRKLNYANEEKISTPTIEMCKIIPPIFGETSDKNIGLLVQVTNYTKIDNHTHRDSVQLKRNIFSSPKYDTECHKLDSDDYGHISNENMEISIKHASPSLTSTKFDENIQKISEVPQVFESVVQQQFSTIARSRKKRIYLSEQIDSNTEKDEKADYRLMKNESDYRFCTTYARADIEPLSIIKTYVEIYPNYTKEITIRLH